MKGGLAVLALVFCTPALAQDSSSLDRLTQRGELLGWEAVGRVDLGNGYCTGALIAPDLVLTAAHCLYNPDTRTLRDPATITFRAGYRDGKSVADVRVARAVAHSDYREEGTPTAENIRHDTALLQLQRQIPAATAAPFALHSGSKAGDRVSVVSYGKGRSEAPSWQRDCGLLDRSGGLMAFDCNVTFGSSGAPVFVREGGRARILSLVSTAGQNDGKPLAFGMELADNVAHMKQQLRAAPGGGLSGTLSAGAKRVTVRNGTGFGNRTGTGAKFVRPGG